MMWSGTIADIPAGWALCDGTKGTPNLLDQFIKGVPNGSTNPGAMGGVLNSLRSWNQINKRRNWTWKALKQP